MQGGCPGFESQWVHVSRPRESCSLSEARGNGGRGQLMHRPARARVGRVDVRSPSHRGRAMTTVCTCNPDVNWTRFIVERVSDINWLLCHLVDGSARAPTKDVPSCDKPQGAAWRRRTVDLRIGILSAIALRNGERRELKHLSTGRKRNRTRCR